jgi:arsenite-transporting ATPase
VSESEGEGEIKINMRRPRILLFTGKGGVGKTTIAAATALRAAELGHRTLVMSSDPAHSLADALDRPLGPEPVEIEANLYGQEIDVYYSIQKYWGTLREYILQVFKWQKVDEVLAEELAALPGMEEGAAFIWVERFYEEGEFDLIVIDSAPTGETLTLLSLPQAGRWWMERIFPVQRKVAKALSPFIRAVTDLPLPEDETYEEVEDLYEKLIQIHEVLSDPEASSIRLVVNPERMVLQEARRAYTYLQLYGYPVDAVIVNRILPEGSSDPLFQKYLKAQKRYLREIEEAFAPLPILRIPHLGQEVFGIPLLRRIGEKLYPERDPTEVFFKEKPYRLTPENGGYLLEIHLPFLEKG